MLPLPPLAPLPAGHRCEQATAASWSPLPAHYRCQWATATSPYLGACLAVAVKQLLHQEHTQACGVRCWRRLRRHAAARLAPSHQMQRAIDGAGHEEARKLHRAGRDQLASTAAHPAA